MASHGISIKMGERFANKMKTNIFMYRFSLITLTVGNKDGRNRMGTSGGQIHPCLDVQIFRTGYTNVGDLHT